MLLFGLCSALGLGNGKELGPSFPSRCYPQTGKQTCFFSLCRHSNAEEGRRWECCAGMASTAEGAGKPTAQDLFDAAFFSCHWSREDGSFRSTKLLLVFSCLGRLARRKREQPRSRAQRWEAAGECKHWHPATLHPHVALASSPPKFGWKRSCLSLEFSSAAALFSEVGLYLLRAQPCFIELFREVCPANALPWAVVTVCGDEQCWCLQEADEVGALSDLCQVFLLLSAPRLGFGFFLPPALRWQVLKHIKL